MSNIYFNVKEAREFLLENGFVYTIRKKRSVGRAIAVVGSYYNHKPIADVDVIEVTTKPVLERGEFDSTLSFYVKTSGFKNLSDWLKAVMKFKPKESLFLYKVIMSWNKIDTIVTVEQKVQNSLHSKRTEE